MEGGWTRDEAQQRAVWSRSGASAWEAGGATQPSADDDDYLKAARRARSKRIGTLSIPVPDEDFDSLDFEQEAATDQHERHQPPEIPPPTSTSDEASSLSNADQVLTVPSPPQWYPPRQPEDHTDEDRRNQRKPCDRSPEVQAGYEVAHGVLRSKGEHHHGLREGARGSQQLQSSQAQTAPEPELEPARTVSAPRFADE